MEITEQERAAVAIGGMDHARRFGGVDHERRFGGPDHERRFGGVGRLYGKAALARFCAAHVLVVGIGGVGSWAAEALARSAVGRITLVDLDHIAESNANRQIHALEGEFGKAKTTAMAERIRAINPDCRVAEIDDFVTPENVAALLAALPRPDYVIDAIDDARAKAALIAHCRQQGIALVSTGGAGGRVDPGRIRVADLALTAHDALAAKLRARLRRDYGFTRAAGAKFGVDCVYSDEPVRRPAGAGLADEESCAPRSAAAEPLQGLSCAGYGSAVCVTASFGMMAASLVLARLAGAGEA